MKYIAPAFVCWVLSLYFVIGDEGLTIEEEKDEPILIEEQNVVPAAVRTRESIAFAKATRLAPEQIDGDSDVTQQNEEKVVIAQTTEDERTHSTLETGTRQINDEVNEVSHESTTRLRSNLSNSNTEGQRVWGSPDNDAHMNVHLNDSSTHFRETGILIEEVELHAENNQDLLDNTESEIIENDTTNEEQTILTNDSNNMENHKEDVKRLWGASLDVHNDDAIMPKTFKSKDPIESIDNITEASTNHHNVHHTIHPPHITFVASTSKSQGSTVKHNPPEGFTFAARVYINPKDALAHFDYLDDDESLKQQLLTNTRSMKELTLPYWDCGVEGSTTSPLRVKDAYFRNAMGSPTSWNSASDGLHPVLVVTLNPCRLELNSGETIDLKSGDVILMEDVIRPGHRFLPLSSPTSVSSKIKPTPEIKLLFLTLPQYHYHTGKEYLSVKEAITMVRKDPCPNIVEDLRSNNFDSDANNQDTEDKADNVVVIDPFHSQQKRKAPAAYGNKNRNVQFWDGRKLRLFILGTIGMSLSALAADFIGRTAPLWLAVGIGGTFFVGFGTYGFTVGADQVLSSIQLWQQRRKLTPINNDRINLQQSDAETNTTENSYLEDLSVKG